MVRARSFVLDERSVAQIGDGLLQFSARVHDDGAVPGYRLLDRLAGNQQKPDAFFAGLDRHLVAAVKKDQGPVSRLLPDQYLLAVNFLFRQYTERFGRITKNS